ncbi:MAG: ABC transporter substrate-binding protein, partial [Proteobacteria bacterium]|nr:ABC transporter substrate-binding protein [Pseudomonadota bacterium]
MKRYLLASILSIVLVASSFGVQAQDYSKYGIGADIPGACSYKSIDAKDYSGRTLNIITHAV